MYNNRKFGTAPVFFTAISTILGAIMFLRFGFAVGNVGFLGTLGIILIGHAVTIPTAMAIAEIATNQKVEGGGEYYIISRSFGLVIGTTLGIALFLSQAISVAFYIMAFAESFTSLFSYLDTRFNLPDWVKWLLQHRQTIGIPALLVLTYIMLTKGANLGVKALYVVVGTLAISLIAFFIGSTDYSKNNKFNPLYTVHQVVDKHGPGATKSDVTGTAEFQDVQPAEAPVAVQDTTHIPDSLSTDSSAVGTTEATSKSADTGRTEQAPPPGEDQQTGNKDPTENESPSPLIPFGFFTVFAIIFPAFTGMTAGVGLSGDLKNPGRSLPLGTLAATLLGMVMYVFVAYKLAASAHPAELADTSKLVMADIAWQGNWIIPVGLAAATISSALGSIMVAPRTLQAIARDRTLPLPSANNWLSKGKGEQDEPVNASVVTIVIAGAFILAGALDGVAQIISMFFMVTYGSLCLISFLNHFAADPSYRPKFKSRWFVSLFGAISCFALMFFMNAGYAMLAIVLVILLYLGVTWTNKDKKSLALIFQGVIYQVSRRLQVFLQKADKEQTKSWRPSAIAFSSHTFERLGLFELLCWIAQRYGFGTYIHHIDGYLSRETNHEAEHARDRLIEMTELSGSNIYIDTLVSPSYTTSISQVIQLPGIAGTENNLLMFEFAQKDPSTLLDIVDNYNLIKSVDFDVLVLGTSERGFGLKKKIHIWITSTDYENANLMILISYILIGHRDWRGAEIKIFAIFPEENIEAERRRLYQLIDLGQLPISRNNIQLMHREPDTSVKKMISERSEDADLTIVGFHPELIKHDGVKAFQGLENIGNVLYVHAVESKAIK